MYIKKIKGTYGLFNDKEIFFHDGLNIIKRDNEWGKTTLISFIKVMFYGINTSKRDKKDFLSEKTKYTSEINFAGEMVVDFEGREITVLRSQTGKTMNFNSYFSNSMQKTEYTSKDFGKNMIGVAEDAYANSALIEADNRLITKNSDLLDLILSMSTTGDISKSYDKAQKTLKDKKQVLTKSSGILKLACEELERINFELLLTTKTEEDLSDYLEKQSLLSISVSKKRDAYEEKFRMFSIAKLELSERANIIKNQSEQILSNLKPNFYELEDINSANEVLEIFEQAEELEYTLRLEVGNLALETAEKITKLNEERQIAIKENSKVHIKKIPFTLSFLFAMLTFFTMFAQLDLGKYTDYSTYIFGFLTLVSLAISFSSNKDHGDVNIIFDEKIEELELKLLKLKQYHKEIASKIEGFFSNMAIYAKKIGLNSIKNKEEVRQRINFTRDINERYLKALDFENNRKDDTNIYNLENVQVFESELAVLRKDLNETERNLSELSSEILKMQLKLDGISPKNQLLHEKDRKEQEISFVNMQISSLDMAIETLTLANDNLTARLSPEISKIASEYFAFLTEDKYDTIILQSDFEAFCKNPKSYNLLSRLKLSTGTREQLYFCLRLAICDVLLLKNVPIILDDPFAFYDDFRMTKAMDLLIKLSKNRQILLLTCQSREQKYLENF